VKVTSLQMCNEAQSNKRRNKVTTAQTFLKQANANVQGGIATKWTLNALYNIVYAGEQNVASRRVSSACLLVTGDSLDAKLAFSAITFEYCPCIESMLEIKKAFTITLSTRLLPTGWDKRVIQDHMNAPVKGCANIYGMLARS
jgi:hypothetical protein